MKNVEKQINFLIKELSLKKGDIIYVLSHKENMTTRKKILDLVTNGMMELYHSYEGGSVRFLVAAANTGKIYGIKGQNIDCITDVPNWCDEYKNNFKKAVIDGVIYKCIRKVKVN